MDLIIYSSDQFQEVIVAFELGMHDHMLYKDNLTNGPDCPGIVNQTKTPHGAKLL